MQINAAEPATDLSNDPERHNPNLVLDPGENSAYEVLNSVHVRRMGAPDEEEPRPGIEVILARVGVGDQKR